MADDETEIPAWLVPTRYTDEPEIPRPGGEDDTPIDYDKKVSRDFIFGDEGDDDGPGEEVDS